MGPQLILSSEARILRGVAIFGLIFHNPGEFFGVNCKNEREGHLVRARYILIARSSSAFRASRAANFVLISAISFLMAGNSV
jgi:hypothetical protein